MKKLLCFMVFLIGCCDIPVDTPGLIWHNTIADRSSQDQWNRDYYDCKIMVENLIANKSNDPAAASIISNLTGSKDAEIANCMQSRGWYATY
jgi:hypothetical protein